MRSPWEAYWEKKSLAYLHEWEGLAKKIDPARTEVVEGFVKLYDLAVRSHDPDIEDFLEAKRFLSLAIAAKVA